MRPFLEKIVEIILYIQIGKVVHRGVQNVLLRWWSVDGFLKTLLHLQFQPPTTKRLQVARLCANVLLLP